MGEGNNKDPAIKLFGKTIPLLPGNTVIDDEVTSSSINSNFVVDDNNNNNNDNDNDLLGDDVDSIHMIQVDQDGKTCHAENYGVSHQDSATSPSPGTTTHNDNLLSGADKKSPAEPSKLEDQKPETTVSPEKTLKKPDKIIPCPRCNSMDTKFCYYNNYNVNQPRHFCRKCQRYWTAGGTMRNVPVGAGRRKNKNRAEIPNGAHPVLAFGSDSPLCESMVPVLSLADQTGFQKRPENLKVQIPNLEASATSASKDGALSQISLPYPPQLPCYSPWPYPWTPQVAFPIYPPPPYWGCVVSNPWINPLNQSSPSSGPNSPTLGKHSRDGNIKELNDTSCERSLWVPKTLRIDDPGEAAKSSIWTTLGLKNSDKTECSNRGSGLFKVFQAKTTNVETSTTLKANPAALSRSQNFQESS